MQGDNFDTEADVEREEAREQPMQFEGWTKTDQSVFSRTAAILKKLPESKKYVK